MINARTGIILAGAFGLLGVAAGAFGAHGLRGHVDARALETWRTGAHYQQLHAVALLAVAIWARHAEATQGSQGEAPGLRGAAMLLFSVGIVIFSGALYSLVLGGPKILGAVAPIGGLCLMGGWLLVAIAGARARPR